MKALGVDTAQANLGLAVVELAADGTLFLLHSERFQAKTVTQYHDSMFVLNALNVRRIRQLYEEFKFEVAGVESAALSARQHMVSIGSIHGAILQALIDMRMPFVYCTPGKAKFLIAGRGDAQKQTVREEIRKVTGILTRGYDASDAASLAIVGAVFLAEKRKARLPTGIPQARIHTVLYDKTKTGRKSGKPAGIMHRKNEFWWVPPEVTL